LLGKEDFVMDIRVLIPLNTKGKPASDCRRAIKEQMFHSFFQTVETKGAIIAILQKLVSSFQCIPGVQLVIQQKPGKEFDFGSTLRLPYPGDSLFGVNLHESILLKLAGSIAIAPPPQCETMNLPHAQGGRKIHYKKLFNL
jgi:hypothetical protein